MPKILFKKNLPNAVVPTRGTSEAAGFDLVAASIEYLPGSRTAVIDTGLSMAFPPGYVLHIYGRSGLASKHSVRLSNCVGVIDADYRGPIKVLLRLDDLSKSYYGFTNVIAVGDRIAQAILVKLPDVEWEEVTELPESIRGEGGFGSTGQ